MQDADTPTRRQATKPIDVVVLVPTYRPEAADNILANFWRQEYRRKILLVVENGPAVGHYAGKGDAVIRSEPGQSSARNAGLDWVSRNLPDAFVANMDDDDIYSPHYLTEHVALASPKQINVKPVSWALLNSGLYFMGLWKEHVVNTGSCIGGTIGHFASEKARYPVVPAGEESGFLKASRDNGCTVVNTSHHNFIYNRTGDRKKHVYRATEKLFFRHMGNCGILVGDSAEQAMHGSPYGPIERLPRPGLHVD